jgi:D-alanine-D-alanine ligase
VGRSEDPKTAILTHVTERRDRIEKRIAAWVRHGSRTSDPIGLQDAARQLDDLMRELGLRAVGEFSDPRSVRTWTTEAGLEGGILLVTHVDVPLGETVPVQGFRRGPEFLFGEGVATSRAPLVQLEFTLRALRNVRALRRRKIGVQCYFDEGRDAQYSRGYLKKAMGAAGRVLVLRPGGTGNTFFCDRRGVRTLRLEVEGEALRLGRTGRRPPALNWLAQRIQEIAQIGSRQSRVAVQIGELRTKAFPLRVPHAISANILISHTSTKVADETEKKLREILSTRGARWRLEVLSDRRALEKRENSLQLAERLLATAKEWEIPLHRESSTWPSVAGLAPQDAAVLCGLGPVGQSLRTPDEAVQRLAVVQRTLLLAEFLHREAP